ncbi:sel1 repeat family protein [bacterium]|nr:sel1 repeat family protein [bacterium]
MRAAGEKGLVDAMIWLGNYYNKNNDRRETFFWFKKAADAGSAEAAYATGNMFAEGLGTKKNEGKAADYYKRAAYKGNTEAALKLSELNMADADTELTLSDYCKKQKDYRESLKHLTRAAELGGAEAQFRLGYIYLTAPSEYGISADNKRAFELFSEAAGQNLPKAQFSLGVMYYYGSYVAKDYDKAFALFEKAAQQKFASAENMLGEMYLEGQGTVKNEAKGWELIEESACHNCAEAQYRLGKKKLEDGDYQYAFVWMKKCTEADKKDDDWKSAASVLSYLYFNGQGTEKDYNEAFKWAEASQDLAASKYLLAYLYYFGLGTGKNVDKSAELSKQASEIAEINKDKDSRQEEILSLCSQKLRLKELCAELKETADKDRKLAGGLLPVSVSIYQNTAQYDGLKPYEAYVQGKAAIEKNDPKGYALLESSARRGCNQGKVAFAECFLPPGSSLKPSGSPSFELEGKSFDSKERLQRYLKWMTSAADNGSLTAAKTLADVYREGRYVGKDVSKIFKYTKQAAMAKDPEYMYRLGICYAQGLGCQKDRSAAVKWIKQAAHMGSGEASQWIKDRRGHYENIYVTVNESRSDMINRVRSYGYMSVAEFKRIPRPLAFVYGTVVSITMGGGVTYATIESGGAAKNFCCQSYVTDCLISRGGLCVVWYSSEQANIFPVEPGKIKKCTGKKYFPPKVGGWEDLLGK